MSGRLAGYLVNAAIAASMAWLSLVSWRGLIAEPGRFLGPAFTGALLVALVGALGRWRLGRWRMGRWYLVLPLQVVILVAWLQHRLAGIDGPAGWVPTPHGLANLTNVILDGADQVNTYASPVAAEHADAAGYLLAVSMLVVLGVDLLGCGLRRTPWAGLPVVVALTVPISVLDSGLSPVLFLAIALLYVLLLATDEVERVRSWSQLPDRGRPRDSVGRIDGTTTVRTAATRIGLATALGALVLPLLIPVADGFLGRGHGPGDGSGSNDPVRLVNPLVDLHRDLVRQDHVALLVAHTDDTASGYLRLTVLDSFDGRRWKPSERDLPAANKADGDLPRPPGLSVDAAGRSADWALTLLRDFRTSWLPAPYPVTSLRPEAGDWRYDSRTMDFANVDDNTPLGIGYRLTAFHPGIEPASLDAAPPADNALRTAMTRLPGVLPAVISETAKSVTESGKTDYQKAVLLQSWFRGEGGFSYSLTPDTGSSTGALVRFITTDKVGYCEQFAAAMAIMARSLHIPARVVVGFLSAERQDDGSLLYTSDALHAWPELYFSGTGWVRFEPTPSVRTGLPPSWTQQQNTAKPSAQPTPSAAPTDRLPVHERTPEAAPTQTRSTGGAANQWAWSVALALLLLLALVPGLVRRRQRSRRLHAPSLPSEMFALGLWTELLATADDLGVVLPESRSIRRVADAMSGWVGHAPADDQDDLRRLIAFVERSRYGRSFEADEATRDQMAAVVETWSRHLGESVASWRRWTAAVLPRSILLRRDPLLESQDRPVTQVIGGGEIR